VVPSVALRCLSLNQVAGRFGSEMDFNLDKGTILAIVEFLFMLAPPTRVFMF